MFTVADILTIVISSVIIFKCIKRVQKGNAYVYALLFFTFFVFPIFLDYIIFFPVYDSVKYYGYNLTYKDSYTRIIYDACVITCLFVLYKKGKSHNSQEYKRVIFQNHNIFWIGALLSPLTVLLFVRTWEIMFALQWRELVQYDIVNGYYHIAEKLTYIGICSTCLLLLENNISLKYPVISKIVAFILLYINVCIEGKRAALFFAIVVMLVIFLYKYIYSKRNCEKFSKNSDTMSSLKSLLYVIAALIAFYFMFEFTVNVKVARGIDDDIYSTVTTTRVDFFRDDRVRMAIFSDIYPDKMTIVNETGQTVRDIVKYVWPIYFVQVRLGFSPLTYQHYLSAALDGNPVREDRNWMTVSIFDELIANFGIIAGTFLYISLCILYIKMTDKYKYPYDIVIVLSFILINLFDLSYSMIFLQFSILAIYFSRTKIMHK